MTEKEKDVIFNELLTLFQQTNVSFQHGLGPMRDYLSRADLQKKSFFLENVDLAI